MVFLTPPESHAKFLRLAILYQDASSNKYVRIYHIKQGTEEFTEDSLKFTVHPTASKLVPLNVGFMVVTDEHVELFDSVSDNASPTRLAMNPTRIVTALKATIEGKLVVLLGDYLGNLYILHTVPTLQLEKMGSTSVSTCYSLLSDDAVFVGSHYGPSQLIRLLSDPSPGTGAFIELVQEYTNLSPLIDFIVQESEGQGSMLACSGVGSAGSLKVIKSGIGASSVAELDVSGLTGVFTIGKLTKYILFSFIGETRALQFSEDEDLEEMAFTKGLASDKVTLDCRTIKNDLVVQATPSSLRLLSADLDLVNEWSSQTPITHASISDEYILVSLAGGELVSFKTTETSIEEVSRREMPTEISCLDVTTDFCAVGLWDSTLRVLALPSLQDVLQHTPAQDQLSRSVLFSRLNDTDYLFVALGDGTLQRYEFSPTGPLPAPHSIHLGTNPAALSSFVIKGRRYVLVSGDHPTLIHASPKLTYSAIDLPPVSISCPFTGKDHVGVIAVSSEKVKLVILDEVEKLHIRSIPLGFTARRVIQSKSGYAVIGTDVNVLSYGSEEEVSRIVKLNETYDVVSEYTFGRHELAQSVTSSTISEQGYVIAGTTLSVGNEDISYLYAFDEAWNVVAKKEVRGAVYSLEVIDGFLIAGIGSRVELFSFAIEGNAGTIESICSHFGHILALKLYIKEDLILIADLQKSVSLLRFSNKTPGAPILEEVAKDFQTSWTVAASFLDQDSFVAAENSFNMYSLRRQDVEDEFLRRKLDVVGHIHIGGLVNAMKPGLSFSFGKKA